MKQREGTSKNSTSKTPAAAADTPRPRPRAPRTTPTTQAWSSPPSARRSLPCRRQPNPMKGRPSQRGQRTASTLAPAQARVVRRQRKEQQNQQIARKHNHGALRLNLCLCPNSATSDHGTSCAECASWCSSRAANARSVRLFAACSLAGSGGASPLARWAPGPTPTAARPPAPRGIGARHAVAHVPAASRASGPSSLDVSQICARCLVPRATCRSRG